MKSRALERERERGEGRRDNGKEGKSKVKEGEGKFFILFYFISFQMVKIIWLW
jgi:hypothetical protein